MIPNRDVIFRSWPAIAGRLTIKRIQKPEKQIWVTKKILKRIIQNFPGNKFFHLSAGTVGHLEIKK